MPTSVVHCSLVCDTMELRLLPVTPQKIVSTVPLHTLADLISDPDPDDLDNDLHALLDWLQPYSSTQDAQPITQRTKAAARRCLKGEKAQRQFVRLWLNLLRSNLLTGREHTSLSRATHEAAVLHHRWTSQASQILLADTPRTMFTEGIHLFLRELINPRIGELDAVVGDCLVSSSSSQLQTIRFLTQIGYQENLHRAISKAIVLNIRLQIDTGAGATLSTLREWVRLELYTGVLACLETAPSSAELVEIAQEMLVTARTSSIYESVLAYPDTHVSLSELHTCLTDHRRHTEQRAILVQQFISSCQVCLLHSGSHTVDIVIAYMKTIQAFLVVDPTGVLLDRAARPIRDYLKGRSDLVLHLVRGMLDSLALNPLKALAEDLRRGPPVTEAHVSDLSDIYWTPDPVDALPDFQRGRALDAVQALVSLFQDTLVVAEEFTRFLGDKLLQWNLDCVQEVSEQAASLKSRFGADDYTMLDVMIHDVLSLNASPINTPDLLVTVLSKLYWSAVANNVSEADSFAVPVDGALEEFGKKFAEMNRGRELEFILSWGFADVELLIGDSVKEFRVTPLQAAVIDLFHDEEDPLSVQTVCLSLKAQNYAATKALQFWVTEGILREEGGKFVVVDA